MNKWTRRDNQHDLSDHEAHFSFEKDIPILERLLLVDKDIQMILDGKFPHDIFGKPEALTLACFHDEKAVFPARFFLERFQNLQSLEVFCSSFEEIFPDEGLVDKELHPVLENLSELKLRRAYAESATEIWKLLGAQSEFEMKKTFIEAKMEHVLTWVKRFACWGSHQWC
ncbi:hypothetical protein NL676_039237 [Syzygium grande]|nr:hypothetical protein NL676_039237 [Syzygium grande]